MAARVSRKWLTAKHGLAALAAGAGVASGTSESDAAVIHTIIGCTLALEVDKTCSIDVNGDSIPDLNVTSESVTRAYGAGSLTYRRVVASGTGSTTIAGEDGTAASGPNGTVPRFEASSRRSASGGEGRDRSSSGGSSAVLQAGPPAQPAQFNDLNGEDFLEIKLTTGDPPVDNFAWIRLLGDSKAGTLTLVDSGFETEPFVRISPGFFTAGVDGGSPTFDDQGWPLTSSLDSLADSGLSTADLEADPQVVPQPASIALMAAGAAAVLALRRRLWKQAPE